MFGIGTWEIVVIVVLALLVLGPAQLPKVARTLGQNLAKLRRSVDEVRAEVRLDEVKKEFGLDGEMAELRHAVDLRGELRRAVASLETADVAPSPPALTEEPFTPRNEILPYPVKQDDEPPQGQ